MNECEGANSTESSPSDNSVCLVTIWPPMVAAVVVVVVVMNSSISMSGCFRVNRAWSARVHCGGSSRS